MFQVPTHERVCVCACVRARVCARVCVCACACVCVCVRVFSVALFSSGPPGVRIQSFSAQKLRISKFRLRVMLTLFPRVSIVLAPTRVCPKKPGAGLAALPHGKWPAPGWRCWACPKHVILVAVTRVRKDSCGHHHPLPPCAQMGKPDPETHAATVLPAWGWGTC